jgi:hypothetical protein
MPAPRSSDDRLTPLLERELRANPAYRLVLFDRLESAERAALAGLADGPDFYGLLRPAAGFGLGVKSVCRETALLFLTLREPGPLPAYVRALYGSEAPRLVARLVADGILEIAGGGGFVSGAGALDLLAPPAVGGIGAAGTAGAAGESQPAGGDPAQGQPARGRLGALSLAALRYGARLALDDPFALSLRLYGYNTLPLTPDWQRRLPSAEQVEGFLGIAPGGPHRKLLDGNFGAAGRDGAWLSWNARAPGPRSGRATFKLYVSPRPEALPALAGDLLAGLAAARPSAFKLGSAAAGLLRPDKIVAYFPSFEALAAAAEPLARRLAGAPVQGVPFTSEMAGDGLLSWGADPPAEPSFPGFDGESWRLWLTHRLARALVQARAAGDGEPWRFALARLDLEGVDPVTWTPRAGVFRAS